MDTQVRWRDVRRILIIKWSALGDVAIATACMDDIRRAFPAATIDLNTMPGALPFFTHDDRFAEVFAIDVRQKGRKLRRTLEWLRRVRSGSYDLVVDLQCNDHSRILLLLLRLTGHRVAHRWGCRGGVAYTLRTPRHVVRISSRQQQVELLETAGLDVVAQRPVFRISAAHRDAASRLMQRHGLASKGYVVFLPGSQVSGRLKRWGTDRFVALGLRLVAEGVRKIAVIGGPDEVDVCREIVDTINASYPQLAVNLAMLPLLQIGPVCEGAWQIVANDTGNAHIAASADRPMVVLCGPTDPARVKPIGAKVRAVQAVHACLNCYAKICRHGAEAACMAAIRPERIADAMLDIASAGTAPPATDVRWF